MAAIRNTSQEETCLQSELFEETEFNGRGTGFYDLCLIERWHSRKDFDIHSKTSYILNFEMCILGEYVQQYDIHLYQSVKDW